MFGKWYVDYVHIIDNYLPMLMEHGFDFYLNGHEHTLTYSNYPYAKTAYHISEGSDITKNLLDVNRNLRGYQCNSDVEYFFGKDTNRSVVFD